MAFLCNLHNNGISLLAHVLSLAAGENFATVFSMLKVKFFSRQDLPPTKRQTQTFNFPAFLAKPFEYE
jgi:hypothetical protein